MIERILKSLLASSATKSLVKAYHTLYLSKAV